MNNPASTWVYIVTSVRYWGSVWQYQLENEHTKKPYNSGAWVNEGNLDGIE